MQLYGLRSKNKHQCTVTGLLKTYGLDSNTDYVDTEYADYGLYSQAQVNDIFAISNTIFFSQKFRRNM